MLLEDSLAPWGSHLLLLLNVVKCSAALAFSWCVIEGFGMVLLPLIMFVTNCDHPYTHERGYGQHFQHLRSI